MESVIWRNYYGNIIKRESIEVGERTNGRTGGREDGRTEGERTEGERERRAGKEFKLNPY